MSVYFIMFFGIVSFLVGIALSTILHELGHGIAAYVLYKGDIKICIGSYLENARFITLKLGRLHIHLTRNPFKWSKGFCRVSTNNSWLKDCIYIFAGPFVNIIILIVSTLVLTRPETHGLVKYTALSLVIASLIVIFKNLIPNGSPIILDEFRYTYNDGQQLKQLIQIRKIYPQITKIPRLVNSNELNKAITLFESLPERNNNHEVLRLGMSLYFQSKQFDQSIELFNDFKKTKRLKSEDYGLCGLCYSWQNNHLQAIELYDQSILLNYHNLSSRINRGYTYNILGKYDEAIEDFNMSINAGLYLAYSFSNQGLSKLKKGFEKEGMEDIQKALEIEPDCSYALKNLGIYEIDKKEYEKALAYFEKAKQVDPNTHQIDDLILETTSLLNS